MDASERLRSNFYERFARAANDAAVGWAVLSGIEGYPAHIGRDLDVTCRSRSDANLLSKVFVSCLHEHKFRWIVFPSPIWGKRIIGITEKYEAVELHIVYPVRVVSVSLAPDWHALVYEGGLFPTDPLLRYFKRCMIPALIGGEPWRIKCSQVRPPAKLPWWMRRTARQIARGRDLAWHDRLALFSAFFVSHPASFLMNFWWWLRRRSIRRQYPAAPVYQLDGMIDPESFLSLAKRSLSEVFTGFACVDDDDPRRVMALQAVQRLVFLTKKRGDISEVQPLPADVRDEAKLLDFIVERFSDFNERWRPQTRSPQ